MASISDTQLLYITYYGRPADPGGLTYWTTGTPASLPLNQVSDYFAADVEYNQTISGKTVSQIVNSFYQNALGRDADASGLAYWVGEVNAGRISTQDVGLFIAQGALSQPPGNSDRVVLENKLTASQQWTSQVAASSDSTSRYNGWLAVASGFKFLKGVTTSVPSTTQSQSAINNLPPVGGDWLAGTKWIFVDFDGHTAEPTESNGNNYRFNATSSGLTAAQQKTVIEQMSAYYAPFNIRFTNDPTKYAGAGEYYGKVVVGKNVTSSANNGPFENLLANGIRAIANTKANIAGFTNPIAAFDVTDYPQLESIGISLAHEVGHFFGVNHGVLYAGPFGGTNTQIYIESGNHLVFPPAPNQSPYYYWEGVMRTNSGATLNFPDSTVQWTKGDYSYVRADKTGTLVSANTYQPQDQVAILANQIGYRPDDFADNITGAPTRTLGSTRTTVGLINNRNDVDLIKFTHAGGSLNLNVDPIVSYYEVGQPVQHRIDPDWHPLNLKADLLNSSGQVVFTSDPFTTKSAAISGSFAAGTYYLRVDGVGQGSFTPVNGTSQGFDDYGSLGSYIVSGLG